jgi:DNA-binding GntR family transcriptional regulator
MLKAAIPPVDLGTLRDQVYSDLRRALMNAKFAPGQKVTIRSLAAALGTSLTPVREALRRLIAEGALEGAANRSVRVPIMTRDKILELRDIRLALEGLAAARAAERISREEIAHLRSLSLEIVAARDRGDTATDIAKVTEFQFAVYRAAEMPALLKLIEMVWVQTGPYVNLLFPSYVKSKRSEWRARLCKALDARRPQLARQEVEADISEVVSYIVGLADETGRIHPRPSDALPAARRRNRTGLAQ